MFGDPYVFLISSLFLIPAALIAVPVHEVSHALAALWQGDSSARNRGLLKPDPRLFIEPYGMLAILLLRTGWGAPVPVNEYRLRGLAGRVAYAVAGPVGNLAVAVIFGVVVRLMLQSGVIFTSSTLAQPPLSLLEYLVYAIFFLNLTMFAFNLLPIPGLDGWRVLEALFRHRNPRFFFDASMRRQNIWMVAGLILFLGSFKFNVLGLVLAPLFQPVASLLLGGCTSYPGLTPCLP